MFGSGCGASELASGLCAGGVGVSILSGGKISREGMLDVVPVYSMAAVVEESSVVGPGVGCGVFDMPIGSCLNTNTTPAVLRTVGSSVVGLLEAVGGVVCVVSVCGVVDEDPAVYFWLSPIARRLACGELPLLCGRSLVLLGHVLLLSSSSSASAGSCPS